MSLQKTSESFDLQYLIQFIKKYWLIVFISIFFSMVIAFLVNKYSTKVYRVATALVINEESGGLANASAELLNEFGFISSNKSFINELVVLESTPLINNTIEKLDFQISYFEHGLFSHKELYKLSPFIVILDKNFPQPIGCHFYIEFLDSKTCKVSVQKKEVDIYSFVSDNIVQEISLLEFEKVVELDSYLYSDYMKFKILLNSSIDLNEVIGKKFSFYINTHGALVNSYKASLEVQASNLESTIAEIQLKTQNPEKAIDFLNKLTDSYINLELERKRHTSVRTIEYINNQLNIVGDSLARAEQTLQRFKTQNEVTDITIQSGQFFEEMREFQNQKAVLEVNKKYYEYVKNYFNKNQEFDELIAPSAMGIQDPMLNNLIEELIRLNAERASFIENKQAKSPYLKKINIRIENLRKMVSENISYYEETNSIKLQDIDSRIYKLNSEIRKLPVTQRVLVGIERKFNVNDAIYTYLLEKRAEAEIAKASYQADTELIEPAHVEGNRPVSPDKFLNYLIGFSLGILIPFIIIKIIELLRTNIASVAESEAIIELPILGNIYHSDKGVENVSYKYPKSIIAENFRHLFVGLKFFFKENKCKTIMISSTVGGEGKSFVALNTAIASSNSGKKTILLAFDLRKSKLANYLSDYYDMKSSDKSNGLTEYLCNQVNSYRDIIYKTKLKNFDFVLSGMNAPNPGQLISAEPIKELFEKLKQEYDYIFIDTAPIGLVSDAYNLIDYVDLNVLLLRIKKTPQKEFKILQNNLINKGIKSCVVINDVRIENKNGYGYYDEES